MIYHNDDIATKVLIVPYRESSIDQREFIQSDEEYVTVSSVKEYENDLVRIQLPSCNAMVVSAEQLITAVKKCVL